MVFKLTRCYATIEQTPPFCDNTAVPLAPPVQISRVHWRRGRQEKLPSSITISAKNHRAFWQFLNI